MKKNLLIAFASLFVLHASGQNKASIEFSATALFNKYDHTINNADGSTTTQNFKSTGIGAHISYKRDISQHWWTKINLGYFSLQTEQSIITLTNQGFFWSGAISNPHYHNISLQAGIGRKEKLAATWSLEYGLEYVYNYTFSQVYVYGGERSHANKGGTCCQFVNADIAVKKHWDRFAVGPSLIAPIYFNVNFPSTFGGQFTYARNLWLSGFGFGLSGEYSLH